MGAIYSHKSWEIWQSSIKTIQLHKGLHKKNISKQAQQTSVPTLKRKEGSANIRFRSIAHDLIAKPRGQTDPYSSNMKKNPLVITAAKDLLIIHTDTKTTSLNRHIICK
jgi:hypothetical protein